MFLLIFYLACLFVVLGTGALAALSDLRGMTIPNRYSVIIIAAFFILYIALSLAGRTDVTGGLLAHLLGMVLVFFITAGFFAFGIMGGGDSKLATSLALWTGLSGFIPFVFYMTLTGGLLGVAALLLRKYKPVRAPVAGGWIARVQAGENKVPYGLAIIAGAFLAFFEMGYFQTAVLQSFLAAG